MAVRPRPRQSTMLLLQEHMGGQDPEARLHGWTKALPLFPDDGRRGFRSSVSFTQFTVILEEAERRYLSR